MSGGARTGRKEEAVSPSLNSARIDRHVNRLHRHATIPAKYETEELREIEGESDDFRVYFLFTDLQIGTCPFLQWHCRQCRQLRSATFPPLSDRDSCPASDDNITFLSATDHLEKARDKARPPARGTDEMKGETGERSRCE